MGGRGDCHDGGKAKGGGERGGDIQIWTVVGGSKQGRLSREIMEQEEDLERLCGGKITNSTKKGRMGKRGERKREEEERSDGSVGTVGDAILKNHQNEAQMVKKRRPEGERKGSRKNELALPTGKRGSPCSINWKTMKRNRWSIRSIGWAF